MIIEKNKMPRVPELDFWDEKVPEISKIASEFIHIHHMYRCAMRIVSMQLESFDDEFSARSSHSPIHHMECRVKSVDSITGKLKRKGYELDMESVYKLTDIAGVRVVCNYTADIYYLFNLMKETECFHILSVKDYIKEPKENGYRSLHIVVSVAVTLSDGTVDLPVEIQIRSIAMDLWASLEHELRYKSDCEFSAEDEARLAHCAETLAYVDAEMQDLFLHKTASQKNKHILDH